MDDPHHKTGYDRWPKIAHTLRTSLVCIDTSTCIGQREYIRGFCFHTFMVFRLKFASSSMIWRSFSYLMVKMFEIQLSCRCRQVMKWNRESLVGYATINISLSTPQHVVLVQALICHCHVLAVLVFHVGRTCVMCYVLPI